MSETGYANPAGDGALLEDHCILGERAGLVREDVFNLAHAGREEKAGQVRRNDRE
jgi:hypothetical protein